MADEHAEHAAPVGDGQPAGAGPGGKGFVGWIRGHSKELGIGLAAVGVLVAVVIWRSNSSAQQNASSLGYTLPTTGTGATDPYGLGGTSPDSMNMDSSNSLLQGLSSLESQNYNALQQLLNGKIPNPGTQDNSGNPPSPLTKKGAWTYTTKAGDTLASLTNKAHWGAKQQKGGGTNFLYGYNNNAAIFGNIGINPGSPNAKIPVGTKISL